MEITLQPIGYVRSTRSEVRDDDWDKETVSIVLDPEAYTADALLELDSFSHVEVIYFFDQVAEDRIERGARHPRGNSGWPLVGIFAQRGKNRPNRLGLTVCRIRGVDGLVLEVEGLDAVDGTPVIDLKPWMTEFAPRGDVRQPAWASELMSGYWATPDR
jgi:tRNA-Thr(GGU) m(6)t(6)A37 methyltransferase TsaA